MNVSVRLLKMMCSITIEAVKIASDNSFFGTDCPSQERQRLRMSKAIGKYEGGITDYDLHKIKELLKKLDPTYEP